MMSAMLTGWYQFQLPLQRTALEAFDGIEDDVDGLVWVIDHSLDGRLFVV
jgi:hypothetical protein